MIDIPRRLTRRSLLAGGGAALGASLVPGARLLAAGESAQPILVEARSGSTQLLEGDGQATPIWGYDGRVPGPVIRAKRGEEVWVRLKNSLPQPTTIHWHGIRIANAMDGVANLTQAPVPPGETFDYRFTVPDAGTYWYHPHNRSWEQVARGLYGALLVDEADAPDVDRDLLMIADDWRLDDAGLIDEKTLGSIFERAHAGRLGNVLTLNGKPEASIAVAAGERIRLRVCNTCNARVLKLKFEDHAPYAVALDGQPIAPRALADGTTRLAPGQRVDLIFDMTGTPGSRAAITEVSNDRVVAGHFVYDAQAPGDRPARGGQVSLAPNGLPQPDLGQPQKVELRMTGGAMGQLTEAIYKGQKYALRELARTHGQVWAMNGIAGMAEAPLFTAPLGRTVTLRMINDTRWQHAMHLHGHHVRVVARSDGAPDAAWRDTVLVEPGQEATLALLADNPGKWMLHCHMLAHQAGGMTTWFEVT